MFPAERIKITAQQQTEVRPEPDVLSTLLANANDLRDVVKFLRKRQNGVSLAEAMGTLKKQTLEARKIAAYEYWGVLSREADRLRLSALGQEVADYLAAEAQAFRVVLNHTPLYRATLKWIGQRNFELVTHADVAGYWRLAEVPLPDDQGERDLKGNIVSFFHLCHAAGIGSVTIGKRGQPARIRVDQAELQNHLNDFSPALRGPVKVAPIEKSEARKEVKSGGVETDSNAPDLIRPNFPPKRLRVLILHRAADDLVAQIRLSLNLIAGESEVAAREAGETLLIGEQLSRAMRACDAAVIVITRQDCVRSASGEFLPSQKVLLEINTASVLYDNRVVVLWEAGHPFPAHALEVSYCELQDGQLTWEQGVKLTLALQEMRISN